MSEQGKLEHIWVKRFKRGPMDPRDRVTLVQGQGIVDNANQGGQRQVTLVRREGFEQMSDELGVAVPLDVRRANLMVSGIELAESRGKVLRIGPCRLLIRGETRPCERMEEALAGLRKAMSPDWRGGCYGEVLEGGELAVGDAAEWE